MYKPPYTREPERKVKQQVDRILKRHKVWFFKPVSNGMGKHGIPDYICCVCGSFLAIECKATSSRAPTPLQQKQLNEIQAVGGATFIAHPDSIGGLDEWLKKVMDKNADTIL